MARPETRQESIDKELGTAEKRINAGLRELSERAGIVYGNLPTAAQNAADLLPLQKAQHLAAAVEALVTATSPTLPSAEAPVADSSEDVPSSFPSMSSRTKKGL